MDSPQPNKAVWWIIGVLTAMLSLTTTGSLVKSVATEERLAGLERELSAYQRQLQRIETKLDNLLDRR